jgi:hypothetical protein
MPLEACRVIGFLNTRVSCQIGGVKQSQSYLRVQQVKIWFGNGFPHDRKMRPEGVLAIRAFLSEILHVANIAILLKTRVKTLA